MNFLFYLVLLWCPRAVAEAPLPQTLSDLVLWRTVERPGAQLAGNQPPTWQCLPISLQTRITA
jgi:hypothetical protein